ncbi:chorismate mutase [Streptomyces sp. Z26]|uniref:chorismate mutase n=1 Tax=Streptomyces sp. Z26 TaxID=2500177 RepID=UPI000EF16DF1|nr:chorismate mutase [Streptomyces sp. Z26]RLL68508.1 chorismate mutase [Streptomyces sp. Z26]
MSTLDTARTAETAGTTRTAETAETTGTTRTASAADTGARDGAAAEISGARERIDALDARIIALVRERMAVSARVQQARLGSGGRRVSLSREMEILAHYRDELGRPGTALAMTLLELSRGRA